MMTRVQHVSGKKNILMKQQPVSYTFYFCFHYSLKIVNTTSILTKFTLYISEGVELVIAFVCEESNCFDIVGIATAVVNEQDSVNIHPTQ